MVTPANSHDLETGLLKSAYQFFAGRSRNLAHLCLGSTLCSTPCSTLCSNRHALNPNEFQLRSTRALHFQTQRDRFPNSLHHFIKGARLRVASGQLRNPRHVVAVFIPLDHDVKLALNGKGSCSYFTSLRRSRRRIDALPHQPSFSAASTASR